MPIITVLPSSDEQLQGIADTLGKSRKVVVVTGAGISTNCGIPDFRSEGGLYSMIQDQFDAALQNPPWELTNEDDINDRPKKKRKASDRWFYRLETADGEIIEDPSKEPSPEPDESRSQFRRSQTGHSADIKVAGVKDGHVPDENTNEELSDQLSKELSEMFTRQSSGNRGLEQSLRRSSRRSGSSSMERVDQRTRRPLTPSSSQSPPQSPRKYPRADNSIPQSYTQSGPSDKAVKSALPRSPPPSQPSESDSTLEPPASSQGQASFSPSNSQIFVEIPVRPPSPSVPHNMPLPHLRRRALQREYSSAMSSRSDTEEPPSSQSSRNSLPNLKGRDLFDSMIWQDPFTTSIFYMFISSLRKKIKDEVTSTTHTHRFIRTLRDGGRLVRNYTQNIDCLEERQGLCTELLRGTGNRARFRPKAQRQSLPSSTENSVHDRGVECVLLHGSLTKLRCGVCAKLSSWDEADRQETTLAGSAPDCPSCVEYSNARQGRGRRSLNVGRLRPDIVLYGEEHPNAHLVAPIVTHDLKLGPDVLLILGTSLRVHGLKIMIKEFAKAVHTKGGKVIFVNRTKPSESIWGDVIDYWVEWDCDAWVLDLKSRREDIWLPQGQSVEVLKAKRLPAQRIAKKGSQVLRDDKLNGVHCTFTILDNLGKVKDANGRPSNRKIYFQKRTPLVSSTSSKNANPTSSRPVVEIPACSHAYPLSASHSSPTKPKTKTTSRKSTKKNAAPLPALNIDAKTTTDFWNHLRNLAPELSTSAPSAGVLQERSANMLSRNHCPKLKGLECPATLITHPPSGLEPSMVGGSSSQGMRRSKRISGGVSRSSDEEKGRHEQENKMSIGAILEEPVGGKRKRVSFGVLPEA